MWAGIPFLHADNGNAIVNLDTINSFFKSLCEIGPSRCYYPEDSKSILIVKERGILKAAYFCAENSLSFKTEHRSRYLGGFVREKSLENEWIS